MFVRGSGATLVRHFGFAERTDDQKVFGHFLDGFWAVALSLIVSSVSLSRLFWFDASMVCYVIDVIDYSG